MTRHLTTPEIAEALMGRPCETCDGRSRVEAEGWDLNDPDNHLGWVPCLTCDGSGVQRLDWLVVDGPTPCTLHEACGCGRMGEGLPHCKLSCEWKIVTDAHRAVRAIAAGERIDIVTRTASPCPECGRATAEDYNPDVWHGCDYCEDDPCIGFAECVEIVAGSVQPVEVLPIYAESLEPHDHWVDRCLVVFSGKEHVLFDPGIDADERAVAVDLSVYGNPAELVGQFAIRVTDPTGGGS